MENTLSRRVKEQIVKNDETVRQTQQRITLCEAWLAAFHEQHEAWRAAFHEQHEAWLCLIEPYRTLRQTRPR